LKLVINNTITFSWEIAVNLTQCNNLCVSKASTAGKKCMQDGRGPEDKLMATTSPEIKSQWLHTSTAPSCPPWIYMNQIFDCLTMVDPGIQMLVQTLSL
jgi:hypothetical protein